MKKRDIIQNVAKIISFMLSIIILTGCSANSAVPQSELTTPSSSIVQSQSQPPIRQPFIAPNPQLPGPQSTDGIGMPLPEGEDIWWGTRFANEQILAAADTFDETTDGSMSSIYVAVSIDDGLHWQTATIHFEKPVYVFFQLEFTSQQEGWISVKQSDENLYLLYKTFDGGKTWEYFTSTSFDYESTTFTFASSMVGWCTGDMSVTQNRPVIQQTLDGGLTWQSANIDIPPDMLTDMTIDGTGFQLEKIIWNDRWELVFRPLRLNGYYSGYGLTYIFYWSNEEQAWLWDAPDWTLPEGVSPVTFLDYVEGYLYPPMEYNLETGLDKRTAARLLYCTADHLGRIGIFSENDIIAYADIDRMAVCMYNNNNFNAQSNPYLAENTAASEGYILEGFWQVGEGEPKTKILDARDCGDGTIEAILERIAEDEETYEKSFFYQRCVFRPTELDGIPYFTLLSAELIDAPTPG